MDPQNASGFQVLQCYSKAYVLDSCPKLWVCPNIVDISMYTRPLKNGENEVLYKPLDF